MLRPNLAQDAPPTKLTVGGVDFDINVDYRVWIGVLNDLREIILHPSTPEHALHNATIIMQLETAVFGRLIDAQVADVLKAITEFSRGYPEAPVGESDTSRAQTYSFDYDLNYIILAIQKQFGVDISYRRGKPFHWWMFLLYFRALSGSHYILKLMEIRGYTGDDKEMRKQARRFALPIVRTANDDANEAELKDIFYNC